MITRWLNPDGDWRSLTANERLPWASGNRRLLGSHQVCIWWHNELALTAAPCFEIMNAANGKLKPKTFFTLFSIADRMHRPQ